MSGFSTYTPPTLREYSEDLDRLIHSELRTQTVAQSMIHENLPQHIKKSIHPVRDFMGPLLARANLLKEISQLVHDYRP